MARAVDGLLFSSSWLLPGPSPGHLGYIPSRPPPYCQHAPPPLCLTPVQCPDLEISTLRLPGSGYKVPRRAHLSDDCSVPAIVRSSAPHCRSFDSNGAVLGPFFQKLTHNPSHLGACKAQVDELGGFKPLQCLSVGWPSVIWCMWAPKQQSNNGITIALLHAAGNCLDPISPVRTV